MYPKVIKIENEKLAKLITEKGALVDKGRAVSEEIEVIEKEMATIDTELQEEEKKVDISDILEKEKVLTQEVEKAIETMKGYKQEIFDRMNEQVPKQLKVEYDKLKDLKEKKESERNKIALKAQKFNDKIIPLGRKMMKPFLTDMYEDFESLVLEDGEIVATIFSHMNDFKTNFKSNKK